MSDAAPGPGPDTRPPAERRRRRRLDHFVLSMAWKTVAVALMASGLLLVTVRLTLPGISHYRPDIERWLSEVLEVPVSIGDLSAEWSGWTPELRIDNVRLAQRDGETVARFARASFTIDPVESIKRGEIRPGNVTLTGATFVITRQRDGAITFTSHETDASASATPPDAVAPWLLRHQQLKLRNTDVVWRDLRDGGPPLVFHDVEVNARNDGERHQFEGTVRLPDDLGTRLTFALDAVGNIMTPAWSGEFFMRGEGIRSRMWGFVEKPLGLAMRGGSGGFEVWTTWKNARLQRAEGALQADEVTLAAGDGVLHVSHGGANVSVWRSPMGWDVDITDLQLTTAGGAWPATSVSLSVATATPEQSARITGRVAFVRLRDLLPLLGAHLPVDPEFIASGRINAEISELAFAFTPHDNALLDLQLRMLVDSLNVAPYDGMPGIQGLRGTVEVAGGRGQLQLDGDGFALLAPASLPDAIAFDAATGRVTWASAASGWQLDTDGLLLGNDDVTARLRGSLRFREGDPSPFMRLVLQLQRGRLAALGGLLPRDLLPEPVTAWLLRGLPAGDVVDGELLLHGLLSDFPFDGASGRLQARLEVAGATLDYQPGWPALSEVHGHVTFEGPRMQIEVDHGVVSGARIVTAQAVIEDMDADTPRLAIQGHVSGTTEQAMDFLAASPMQDDFATALAAVAVRGPSDLDLELDIPLGPQEMKLRGALRLAGNTVAVKGLRKGLENLSGRVDFTALSVTSHTLEARYLGRRVALDLARGTDARLTRIGLRGRADRDLLLAHFRNVGLPLESGHGAALLLDHADGESDFIANLDVPDDWQSAGTVARLEAQSTLEGVSLSLPAPVGKRAAEQRLLKVRADIHGDGRRLVSFGYGDVLAGTVELLADAGSSPPGRGVLVFGAKHAGLPDEAQLPGAGLVRITGRIAALSTNDWYSAIKDLGARLPTGAASFAVLDQVAEIDVHVADLRVLDYQLSDVGMAGERGADGAWSLRFAGRDIAGGARLPPAGSAQPVDIELDHLVLNPGRTGGGAGAAESYDPRGLPPVSFLSRSLRHGELDLGRVVLRTLALPDGVDVEHVAVQNDAFLAEGSGSWQYDGSEARARSRFDVDLQADRLGGLLAAFGYETGNTEGGPTRVEIAAQWDGAPSEFTLRGMRGTLRVDTGPGKLLEVSTGAAGRVFGLLSLASLPRRLRLDFGDLFGDGFSFERIEGSFALDGGNAYTNDLSISGTAAQVDVAGRTGLVRQDYDQLVTVTPRLASTLPIAGAVLGPVGAGVGTVIWLAEQLFKQPMVDQFAAVRYTITGPWDDPLVEAVAPPARESSSTDERG